MKAFTQRTPWLGAAALVFSITALTGCHSQTRPRSLDDAKAAAQSPKGQASKTEASLAFKEAEAHRRAAEQAFENGDEAGADILAERALAAYEKAFAQARLARALKRKDGLQAEKEKADKAAADADNKLKRAKAEVQALELRLKVIRDAQRGYALEKADPKRKRARRVAARSLLAEASLLCRAAELAGAKGNDLTAAQNKLRGLEKSLGMLSKKSTKKGAGKPKRKPNSKSKQENPITQGYDARAACMALLSGGGGQAQSESSSDKLVDELAGHSGSPRRDDRGVSLTYRGLFKGDKLSKTGSRAAKDVALIAKAHPKSALLVVFHAAKRSYKAHPHGRETKRSDALLKALVDAGGPKERIALHYAGGELPVVAGKGRAVSKRNQRVEFLFVEKR